MKAFQIDNSKYGNSHFKLRLVSGFFSIYFKAILISIAIVVPLGFLANLSTRAIFNETVDKNLLFIETGMIFYLGVIALSSYNFRQSLT